VQDVDLFAQHPVDNKQRFNPRRQIDTILDQLLDARVKLGRPGYAHLETEVAQSGTQAILNGDDLRCKSLRWVSSIRSF